MSMHKNTVMQDRIETLDEIAERGGRFEYEAICEDYEPHVSETDAAAVKAAISTSLQSFFVAIVLIALLASIPYAIRAWRDYSMSQSTLWREYYEQERAREQIARQEQKIDAVQVVRTASGIVGLLLTLVYLHKRFNRVRPRAIARRAIARAARTRSSPDPPQAPPAN